MKKILFCLAIAAVLVTGCTQDRTIVEDKPIVIDPTSELIYYWNFNSTTGTQTSIAPDFDSSTAVASITYDGIGDGYMDGDIGGYDVNARNGDIGGNLLKVRNPSDTRELFFNIPTNGFKNMVLRFALSRSNSGATIENYSYTVDGTNYITTGLSKISHNPMPDPIVDLITLDFSSIATVNDNPNFKVKVEFAGDAAAGLTGNNRFDNVTLEGIPLP
jgi:hypothetical protein